MTTQTATTKSSKGYKGMAMEGSIATWYARNTLRDIEEFRKDARVVAGHVPPGGAILEVAPGPGYLAIELARLGSYAITGLDISRTFVEIAQQNAREAGAQIDFRYGNASQMPFAADQFDFIVCRAAFKNFSEPVAALDEMRRVLKPGGRFLVGEVLLDPDFISLPALRAMASDAGFVLERQSGPRFAYGAVFRPVVAANRRPQ